METEWDETSAKCAAMVAQRNLTEDFVDTASGAAIDEALRKLTHVWLDRERIASLDTCAYVLNLPNLTHFYLQENELTSLGGIEVAKGLQFLFVAGNRLNELRGISSLGNLKVLDVSDNAITRINAEAELPKSLSFVNVDGNPCCTSQPGLREHLRTALPNLKELDGDPMTDSTCSDYDSGTESRDEGSVQEDKCEKETVQETPVSQGSATQSIGRQGAVRSSAVLSVTEAIGKLGTSSSLRRTSEGLPEASEDHISEAAKEGCIKFRESLLDMDSDPDDAMQRVLESSSGALEHRCKTISKGVYERIRNLDAHVSENMVQLFFSTESSPEEDAKSSSNGSPSNAFLIDDVSDSNVAPTMIVNRTQRLSHTFIQELEHVHPEGTPEDGCNFIP